MPATQGMWEFALPCQVLQCVTEPVIVPFKFSLKVPLVVEPVCVVKW